MANLSQLVLPVKNERTGQVSNQTFDISDFMLNGINDIPSNSDLNDYKSAGTYTIPNEIVAATISNVPVEKGGKLFISRLLENNNWQQCLFLTYDGDLYSRSLQDGTNWTSWVHFITSASYTNAALGTGYGTCDTASATVAKTATFANYVLAPNGYVTIKFTNSVPANSTLNINNTGAKPIYYKGAPIKDGIIILNDLATFVYNGSRFDLISVDKGAVDEINHNVPRKIPKDITNYVTDGSLWDRIAGHNGYALMEDLFVGDYIEMSRAITAPSQDSSVSSTVGSKYVTIAGIDTRWSDGDGGDSVPKITYHHLVMVPGKGYSGIQHFGKKRMNSSASTANGYNGSEMNTATLGAAVTSGSTAAGATINQQLYAEFGSHLKTIRQVLTNAVDTSRYNRWGVNSGASSNVGWYSVQAVLMDEIEVLGASAWSSSGYEAGTGNKQLSLFSFSSEAISNGENAYWLKNVANSSKYCGISASGGSTTRDANNVSMAVRPRFILA